MAFKFHLLALSLSASLFLPCSTSDDGTQKSQENVLTSSIQYLQAHKCTFPPSPMIMDDAQKTTEWSSKSSLDICTNSSIIDNIFIKDLCIELFIKYVANCQPKALLHYEAFASELTLQELKGAINYTGISICQYSQSLPKEVGLDIMRIQNCSQYCETSYKDYEYLQPLCKLTVSVSCQVAKTSPTPCPLPTSVDSKETAANPNTNGTDSAGANDTDGTDSAGATDTDETDSAGATDTDETDSTGATDTGGTDNTDATNTGETDNTDADDSKAGSRTGALESNTPAPAKPMGKDEENTPLSPKEKVVDPSPQPPSLNASTSTTTTSKPPTEVEELKLAESRSGTGGGGAVQTTPTATTKSPSDSDDDGGGDASVEQKVEKPTSSIGVPKMEGKASEGSHGPEVPKITPNEPVSKTMDVAKQETTQKTRVEPEHKKTEVVTTTKAPKSSLKPTVVVTEPFNPPAGTENHNDAEKTPDAGTAFDKTTESFDINVEPGTPPPSELDKNTDFGNTDYDNLKTGIDLPTNGGYNNSEKSGRNDLGYDNSKKSGTNELGFDDSKKSGTNDLGLSEEEVPSSGHFFAYFLTAVVICISGYVIFHNKQKILAFIIEGRDAARGGRKRTNNGVKYSQLQSNVEEVIPSLDKATSVKNFVY